LKSDDFDNLDVHPHIVEELRKEAYGECEAKIDWSKVRKSSFVDVGVHTDPSNGSRYSDNNLTSNQFERRFEDLSLEQRAFLVAHGLSSATLSSGSLCYSRETLTDDCLYDRSKNLTGAAKFLYDRIHDIDLEKEGTTSNNLRLIDLVQDRTFPHFIEKNIVNGSLEYGRKDDYKERYFIFMHKKFHPTSTMNDGLNIHKGCSHRTKFHRYLLRSGDDDP
jgi:hypothetical protein